MSKGRMLDGRKDADVMVAPDRAWLDFSEWTEDEGGLVIEDTFINRTSRQRLRECRQPIEYVRADMYNVLKGALVEIQKICNTVRNSRPRKVLDEEAIGKIIVEAMTKVGEVERMRCPHCGEVSQPLEYAEMFGGTWYKCPNERHPDFLVKAPNDFLVRERSK